MSASTTPPAGATAPAPPGGGAGAHEGPPLLRVRGVRKTFGRSLLGRGGFRALTGVDLEVGRGSVFGLLGPNGAGKTTLVKILLGLVRGYEGEAQILGRPAGDAAARRRVGYLPEAHRLPGYLSGRQLLRLFGQLSGTERAQVRRRAEELLAEVGLAAFADKKIRTYSKGMQQRLGLAQALVHDPELVFLDEPTDGVDPIGRKKIRELVEQLRERGVTVFINSHLLMEVEMICDRVVIMHRGAILREGTIAELTPATGGVRFELAGAPDDLAERLGELGAGISVTARGFEAVADLERQNRIIDRLRALGVAIRRVEPRRLSLEEAFIDLIGDGGRR